MVQVMLGCRYAQKISAYHDKELSSSACRELEAHLELCPECARALREFNQVTALLHSAIPSAVPGAALARLREIPRQSETTNLLPEAKFLTGLATLLLVVSVSVSTLFLPGGGAFSSSQPDWEETATMREMDADLLDEPEIALAHWVIPEFSVRVMP
jgi:anti-sigma factor RsiW